MNLLQIFTPRRIRDRLVENIAQPVVDNPSSKEHFLENERPNPRRSYLPAIPTSLKQMRNDEPVVLQPIPEIDQCSVFANFLQKKDLLSSRLLKFDDKSENYMAWKHSFQSVIHELNISPSEELYLRVTYLGLSSTNQAISIRSSNPYNHEKGLQKLWNSL